MAKTATTKTPKATFSQIVADIRKGCIAPVYVLSGPEPYFIDKISELLQQKVVAEDAKDFDQTVIYGADCDAVRVINEARRFPMAGERQLVMLREAQAMRDAKGQLEKIAGYVASPSPSTVLVIAYKHDDPLSASSPLVKAAVKSGGVVLESPHPKEWQLDSYVLDYCKERRAAIDRQAAQLLAAYTGNDLSRLFGETEKLIIASDGKEITPELIERNIGISKDFNNFELIAAVSQRNFAKAMQIVLYFKSNPKQNPPMITGVVLFNFFSNLLIAKYTPDSSEQALMSALGFKSAYQLKDIKTAMPRYTAGACTRIIHAIREFDGMTKGIGSTEDSYELLRELIFKIFTL